MEELDPDYYQKLQSAGGGFLVAGTNFGCGSSREQAPLVLREAGTQAVLAKSFARIFYRNAINTGLPVVICDTDRIVTGDDLSLDLKAGVVHNNSRDFSLSFAPLPPVMATLLEDGGLAAHIRKHGSFAF
jgi:3-isopropylmalate/(R)-2-methylmalate dehydratase small subunit